MKRIIEITWYSLLSLISLYYIYNHGENLIHEDFSLRHSILFLMWSLFCAYDFKKLIKIVRK